MWTFDADSDAARFVRYPAFYMRRWAFVILCLVGCGDDDGTGASGGAGGGGAGGGQGGGPPDPEITWTACPAEGAPDLTCADIPVPLEWGDLHGGSVDVHVARLEATTTPRASLWLLEGGPGAPGAWMIPFAARMHEEHPDLDIFIPDHRGTGGTAALLCDPATDPPSTECLEALEEEHAAFIPYATTTESAHDVSTIAQRTSRAGVNILYGRSYGTFWAHRAVTLHPAAWDTYILDSPCHPSGCNGARRDAEVDVVGRAFLSLCDDDATCSAAVGGDALALAETVVAAADAGACAGALAGGLTGNRLRQGLSMLLSDDKARSLIPAVLVRYERCNASDVAALTSLADYVALFENVLTFVPDFSLPENYHVTRTEFWEEGFTVADAEDQLAETLIASGASVRWARAFETWPWPIPEVDPSYEAWTDAGVPSLVLVGGLDTSTPAHEVEDGPQGLGSSSQWVTLAFAGHVSSADPNDPYAACALSMIDQVLESPGAAVDDACITAVDAPTEAALFEIDEARSTEVLGTADAYGD